MLTGDQIRVTYKNGSGSSTSGRRMLSDPPSDLDSIDVVSESEGHEIWTGTQIRVRSMVYLIRTCGWNASATVDVGFSGLRVGHGYPGHDCDTKYHILLTAFKKECAQLGRSASCLPGRVLHSATSSLPGAWVITPIIPA